MNRIVLVTMNDCESCSITERRLRDAIASCKKLEVTFEIKEREKVKPSYLKMMRITDFPTVLFYKDTDLVFKFVGNYPTIVILQWIHKHYIDT